MDGKGGKEKGESKENPLSSFPLGLFIYYFFWRSPKAIFSLALLAIVVKMATISEDSLQQTVNFFSEETIDQIAKETGFSVRKRKLPAIVFLGMFTFGLIF